MIIDTHGKNKSKRIVVIIEKSNILKLRTQ